MMVDFQNSKTKDNLMRAFAGESQARNRYTFAARQAEQAKLQIAYESAFNLTEIEEYATAQLGMQKPTADQIYYIDTSSPDKAVIVQQTEEDSFVDRVSDFLMGIGEYFR